MTRRPGTKQREMQTQIHKVMGNRWKQSGQSKKEGKQEGTGNTNKELTQGDKTTKIKQETMKSNPKP